MKIFIVEDEKILNESICDLLTSNGYKVETTFDFVNIIDIIKKSNSNLILLDINLPEYNGYYICKELRKTIDIPIIVVTSKNNDMDELMSLNFGADDFITKPYNPNVLLAHIEVVLKRYNNVSNERIEYKGVILNMSKSIVTYKDNSEELTKNEFKILSLLLKNKGKIVSRSDIMDNLWQNDFFVDDNALTVNMNRLRKKLKDIGVNDFIKTKRSQGYII